MQGWFKQQATYTDSIISRLNGRDSLVSELTRLDAIQPASYRNIISKGGRWFYRKTTPGESVGKIYYREGANGKE